MARDSHLQTLPYYPITNIAQANTAFQQVIRILNLVISRVTSGQTVPAERHKEGDIRVVKSEKGNKFRLAIRHEGGWVVSDDTTFTFTTKLV